MNIKNLLFKPAEINLESVLPDLVIFCDRNGKIVWVNDETVNCFNVARENLLGSNLSGYIENPLGMINSVLLTQKSSLVKMAENDFYFDMNCKEVSDGYVLILRKCLQTGSAVQENLDKQYKIINREKNQFLLKISNDLKSPLQSIIGFSQAISDGLGGNLNEQQDKYVKIIRKNSTELMYFIEKMLEFSASESSLQTPELKTFDIISTVNSTIKYIEQLNKDKEINYNFNVEDGLKNTIVSNQEILKKCIQNILEVFVKSIDIGELSVSLFTPDEEYLKRINLATGEYLCISIFSSSLILTEAESEAIFDPYLAVDSTNRKNLLRTMILSCVKNLAQTIGAFVWMESEILKSTAVKILIPLKNIQAETSQIQTEADINE